MHRKVLYAIAVAWVLAFIWQTYAHAADPRNDPQYIKCLSNYLLTYRLHDLRTGPRYSRMSTRQIQHNPTAMGLVRDGRRFCWSRGNPS